jgi:hypothetical protein
MTVETAAIIPVMTGILETGIKIEATTGIGNEI